MGMNMVSKGVENVLGYLRNNFPDMDVISISGFNSFLANCDLHSLKTNTSLADN